MARHHLFTREQLDQVYPDHGISEMDWAWMTARVTPQPLRTYTQPATTKDIDTDATRLADARCLRTHPAMTWIDESAPGWEYRTLHSGHWPMITDPLGTADTIEYLADALTRSPSP